MEEILTIAAIIGFAWFLSHLRQKDQKETQLVKVFLSEIRFSVPSLVVLADKEKGGDHALIYATDGKTYYTLHKTSHDVAEEIQRLNLREKGIDFRTRVNTWNHRDEIKAIKEFDASRQQKRPLAGP